MSISGIIHSNAAHEPTPCDRRVVGCKFVPGLDGAGVQVGAALLQPSLLQWSMAGEGIVRTDSDGTAEPVRSACGNVFLTTSTTPRYIQENFEVSNLPEDTMQEIRDSITTSVRFKAVVRTGVSGFIP
jgi:hypothetical protein